MPEGDTVYRAARLLDRALTGQVLTATDFRVPQHATADLSGGTVVEHRLPRQAPAHPDRPRRPRPWTLHTHLKMEGAWRVLDARPALAAPGPPGPGRPRRPRDTVAVGFSLGIVELLDRADEDDVVGHLGPDLLGPDWDADEAVRRLLAEPGPPAARGAARPAQPRRHRQHVRRRAVLRRAASTRRPRSAQVPDLRRLVRRAHQMLDLNKERAFQSTTGNLRERERMWVYRRDRSPCRRCGTPIAVEMQGPAGRERASYWCPSCQPPG